MNALCCVWQRAADAPVQLPCASAFLTWPQAEADGASEAPAKGQEECPGSGKARGWCLRACHACSCDRLSSALFSAAAHYTVLLIIC